MSDQNGCTNGYTNGYTNGHARILNGVSPLLDRRPPQNLEAERGVLGSVLLAGRSVLDEIAAALATADFYRDSHQILYRAMLSLYVEGQEVDGVTVADRLEATGEMARIGDGMLSDLVMAVPHAANARYYAAIVREKAVKRTIIEAASGLLRDAYADDTDAAGAIAMAERAIFDLSARKTAGSTRAVEQILPLVVEAIERRQQGEVSGLSSGFPDLDYRTGGFHPGQLIVVAARPSHGKSALAWAIAEHVAVELRKPALFASLEMTAESLVERALSARAMVNGDRIRTGYSLKPMDVQRLGVACDELRPAPIYVDDTPGQTMLHVMSTARRTKLRHGLALSVVDYAQLCESDGSGDSRQEQVAEISRRLKTMARELQVPVIALSQLNRQCEARPDHAPILADLRESGAIEQDADIVILMHRPEFYDPNDQPGIACINVAKNRNGATGRTKLMFQKAYVRFDSLDERRVEEPIDAGDF